MKKIIIAILFLFFIGSFSLGARLSISPEEWNLANNCIEEFKVILDMDPNDEAITMDLIVKSNMEFVKFENESLFNYATPANVKWDITSIMLFNDRWWEISKWGVVWTLFYKTMWVNDPYIEYYFLWEWETTDTNANIDGRDILKSVKSWIYAISLDKVCENPAVEIINLWDNSYESQMDEFIENYEKDHVFEKILWYLIIYKWYICWFILLVVIALLVSHKIQKKW